jgi:hypothetical protein
MDTTYDSPDEIEVEVDLPPRGAFRSATRPRPQEPQQASADAKPRGRSYSEERDWRKIGLVAASAAAGLVVGAGLALLFAPYSGEHARLALSNELRRRRPWKKNPWDRLGNELAKTVARRNRRSARSARAPRFTAG